LRHFQRNSVFFKDWDSTFRSYLFCVRTNTLSFRTNQLPFRTNPFKILTNPFKIRTKAKTGQLLIRSCSWLRYFRLSTDVCFQSVVYTILCLSVAKRAFIRNVAGLTRRGAVMCIRRGIFKKRPIKHVREKGEFWKRFITTNKFVEIIWPLKLWAKPFGDLLNGHFQNKRLSISIIQSRK
jgi:hypothetical protein